MCYFSSVLLRGSQGSVVKVGGMRELYVVVNMYYMLHLML